MLNQVHEVVENPLGGGRIEVVAGPMFSGKSEELIRLLRRAAIARQRVQVFKPAADTREPDGRLVTRDKRALDATTVGHLPPAQMTWLRDLLDEHGSGYARRVAFSHLPVWPVAQRRERDFIGDPALQRLLREPPSSLVSALADLGFDEPGLNRVIRTGYKLLGLETFFTAGPKEVRAWTTKIGATAPEAAGEIHSDMQERFIRAEVMALEDLLRVGSRHGLHDQGLIRTVGRDYEVQDRDVLQIHFK